jgi:ubiquinone/menaquinone biosynthesis C-methylase UbiE
VNFYERCILPPLLDLAMQQRRLDPYRRAVMAAAHGRVVEIGVGSGLNFKYYGEQAEMVFGIEPSRHLLAMARRRAQAAGVRTMLIQASATALPLAERSVDAAVMTWVLCSIPDPLAALREIRRVLKPGGKLLFAEHGLSPELGVERWQHRLTPIWRRLAGGCHLNRNTAELMRSAGYQIAELRTGYARGPRPMTYMYEGCALRSR